jgi:Cdc6-like AAA superfamily ATPase
MYEVLKNHITKDEPFGPIDSGDFDSNAEVLNLLFERQNRTYKNLHHRPSIIMGRRGSGKTSYLRTVYFDKQYDFYTEINTATVLEHISSVIEGLAKETTFTETLAKLWEKILWTCVLSEIRNRDLLPFSSNLIVVGEYLDMMGIKKSDKVEDALWKLVEVFKDAKTENTTDGISEVLRKFNKIKFGEAQSAVIDRLNAAKKTFVILMDSLENFHLDIESIKNSLEGLLKCVGSMNKSSDVVDIRFCLPTELYRTIIEISSNQTKDFKHALKLEWKASELVLIGSQRLMYFLELYYPGFIKRKLSHEKIGRADAMELFNAVLPEKITNRAGFQENSISYILRHTQLLPRHFLLLLNSIFKSTGTTQSLKPFPFPISEEKITRGIRQVEERIVREIFGAFKLIHPEAGETCKRCLPELEHEFSMGDLHRVFNRHGKAVFGSDNFIDFQRMLKEIGAMGRVDRDKMTDVYITGEFEYAVDHELPISHDDRLCIHPLFSGIFRGPRNKDRPVYPYGSVLDDEEE